MFYKFFIIGIAINTIQFFLYKHNRSWYITLNITIMSYLLTYNLLY